MPTPLSLRSSWWGMAPVPAEHVVPAVRALELTAPSPSTLQLAEWASRMGQDLVYPPNVGGWKGGRSWMGSRSVVARANFGNALATGKLWRSRGSEEMEMQFKEALKRNEVSPDESGWPGWLSTVLWGSPQEEVIDSIATTVEASKTPFADIVGVILARPEQILG